MAENQQTNKERLQEITQGIEQGIKDLFASDRYAQYLRTMSRFHQYSLNNTMLIFMQNPHATLVAGFNKWKDQFERQVRRGEKGIKIIAPTPYKKRVEMDKLDPATQQPVMNPDGSIATEEKEITVPMYRPVTVFDVGQTIGKPIPTLASDLTGNVERFDVFMEALKRSSPVPFAFEAMAESTDGYFNLDDQRIAIRAGMSEVQTVAAAIHEIAHAKLHNHEKARMDAEIAADGAPQPPKSRRTEEVEAESISYAVCQYYGIETKENSFGYIATWSKDKELPELRAALETINRTASDIINSVNGHYRAVEKEQPQAVLESEVEKDSQEQEAMFLLDGETYIHIQATDDGYDYTFYDLELHAMDGGSLDTPELSLDDACLVALEMHAMEMGNAEKVSLDILDNANDVGQQEITDAQQAQILPSIDEQTFLSGEDNAFAIYQIKEGDEYWEHRFQSLSSLENDGLSVERDNYDFKYARPLHASDFSFTQKLEGIYTQFNVNIPEDFHGHSLSMSDIVALKQNGSISCHYVDTFGYQEMPGFLPEQNPLRSLEDAVEQNDNHFDGIINNLPSSTVHELETQAKEGKPISLASLAKAMKEEQKEKPSVLEQLKQPSTQEKKEKSPKRSVEKEL